MWLTCFPRLPADEPLQLFVHPVCNPVLPILKVLARFTGFSTACDTYNVVVAAIVLQLVVLAWCICV
jgi:hypothetical protein